MNLPVGRRMTRKEVIEDIDKNVPRFVGIKMTMERKGVAGGAPGVSLLLWGNDTEKLAELSVEVERRLQPLPSIISIESDLERGNDEVQVHINRDLAQKLGISPQAVGRAIGFTLQGVNLPRYQSDRREVNVRLFMEKLDRQTLHHLRNFTFPSESGEAIALSEFAHLEVHRGQGTIRREDGKVRMRVRAFTTKKDLKNLYGEIDQAMVGFELPRGNTWDKGERYVKLREQDDTMMFAGIMAVTYVFLLMGVLFEPFILPFSVLFSIPAAFLDVYWFLFITNTEMNEMAMVGVIVLIGVVVNNAIVLVDMINRERTEGMERMEAILEAGYNRFRPIMMTTFTTVFGLLPMALGSSNVLGEPYSPLGRTMIGGLVCSTLLTLLMVPLIYTLLDDLRTSLGRITASTFGFLRPVPTAEPAQADD